jgi:hypothetical protein
MARRALLRVLALVTLLVAGTTLAFAAPAQAAPKPIGLSPDGVTYADTLSASLFAGALIVPGDTVTRSFWVKNRDADPGNLAIALQGVAGGDSTFVAALSLSAVAGASAGPSVAFTSANPCVSLASGVGLASGAAVRVDLKLKLGSSLGHVSSQSSVGNFNIKVTLTSTDVTAPTGCAPVTPPRGGGGGGGSDPTIPPGEIDSAVISGSADGSVLPTLADGPLSGLGGKGSVRNLAIVPNTGRFWQEFDVTGYLVALVLGGIFAWWRRRRTYEEEVYA